MWQSQPEGFSKHTASSTLANMQSSGPLFADPQNILLSIHPVPPGALAAVASWLGPTLSHCEIQSSPFPKRKETTKHETGTGMSMI